MPTPQSYRFTKNDLRVGMGNFQSQYLKTGKGKIWQLRHPKN
jgi:hypothetical protein